MTPELKREIDSHLNAIEDAERVRIIYACESGSRAWGFASTDSDFDVRFLYLHDPDWYLSIELEHKRPVIELPLDGTLDINGWDLRKALRLLRKSNPPLLEWLGSPIVYRERYSVAEEMRALAAKNHSPVGCAYHYLHMAQGNFREFLRGSEVWRKKYFYVLRPLLALRWIELGYGVVPTEFQPLVERVIDKPELRREIDKLVREKQEGLELGRGPRIEQISQFIESELLRLEAVEFGEQRIPPVNEYDHLFRKALVEVWGTSRK